MIVTQVHSNGTLQSWKQDDRGGKIYYKEQRVKLSPERKAELLRSEERRAAMDLRCQHGMNIPSSMMTRKRRMTTDDLVENMKKAKDNRIPANPNKAWWK